ncbi:YqiA/YcfP family alpha/beta fold hydrolase [Thiosulfativibrio zosterae]|uniref:Esterase YqiA n=1 Tax=Thiosulfativibrio zosterae TaxID=2675053 RepID=A0A6F8PNS0_9GAMM|nr:YqiA/YcfP family alpha/beta fold hydrolase [Thiosulfativibrio zosterae]BBP43698.1 esterase YqiA [Thiosulfativibrio zosterae]
MILYLHGFLSTGQSAKGQWFKQAFAAEGIAVITPTYPIASPQKSIEFLETEIQRLEAMTATSNWLVMGSSMGGFYGQYLAQKYRKPLVMINPALQAVEVLGQYQGAHVHPKTQETLVLDEWYLAELKAFTREPDASLATLLLLDEGDEVIPFQPSLTAYESSAEVLCYPGGSHAFDHLTEAWPSVLAFVKKELQLDAFSIDKASF